MDLKTNRASIELIAKVLIINKQKEALVLTIGEHRQNPDRSYTPDLPGGIAEKNEDGLQAVIRETREEAGIKLNANDLNLAYTKTEYKDQENKSVSKMLYFTYIEKIPKITLSREHASYKWVPIDELLASNKFRLFFEEAIKYSIDNNLIS
ncbi:MAG: NUDIX hydrolase [Candidatus Saccharibacteria bacterium]